MTDEVGGAPDARRMAGFGIYIHWPFCAAKCPYCDFNSHVAARIDHDAWAEAFEIALDHWVGRTAGRTVGSIFFGGGTPSLMAPDTVARALSRIAKHWSLADDVEITLEANPSSVEASRFSALRSAGVNRVSLGVQALNDADLRRLGRLHSAQEARAAIDIARAQFDRVSFDLIYARQDQSAQDWQNELGAALSLGMDHLSLYQLTIEPGTPFHARRAAGGLRGLPDEDRAVRLFEITQELCGAAGLPGYEVSNHARPGAESRHNLIYWRGGEWLGIGPGAHGRIDGPDGRQATEAQRDPDAWRHAIMEGGDGLARTEVLTRTDEAMEYAMMSLRLAEGLDLSRLDALGHRLAETRLLPLIEEGLLRQRGTRLQTTARGRLLLNAVLAELLAD